MKTLNDCLPKIALRPYTPEQLEAARRKVAERNALCLVDCPICGGLGFVRDDNGHVTPCPNVDPLKLYPGERYGLSDKERGATWGEVVKVNNVTAAVGAVKDAMEAGHGWVYLWGPPGVGKTLILKIAVASWLRKHHAGAYCRMVEILDNLKAAFDTNAPSEESQKRLDWWADLPLLAIDEFDRANPTPYAAERRFLLMDRRYEQALREKSVTLMASNADPAGFETYLADRVRDGRFTIIHIQGKSFRPGAE